MDAIGLSVGLAGAKFGSNGGYTIFAGIFYKEDGPGTYYTLISKTFDNPVQGIMGWFGSSGTDSNSVTQSGKYATTRFTDNIELNPQFISSGVYYSTDGMGALNGSAANAFNCSYTAGTSLSVDFGVVTGSNSCGTLCCYFYIFF